MVHNMQHIGLMGMGCTIKYITHQAYKCSLNGLLYFFSFSTYEKLCANVVFSSDLAEGILLTQTKYGTVFYTVASS